MKKWILIGSSLVLLIMIVLGVNLITGAVRAGESVDQNIILKGIKGTPLTMVTKAEHYFGTEPLIILFGKDRKGQEMVVWMREDGKILHYDWQKNGITDKEVLQLIKENDSVGRLIHIVPGIENGIYLWEALFRTEEGHYQYVYYDFKTGTFLRSIKLKNPNKRY
jgi:uncharacterized protein YpmB